MILKNRKGDFTMKKLFALLLTLALSFSLVACGNDDNNAADDNNNAAVEDNNAADNNNAGNNNVGNDQNNVSNNRIDRDIDAVADYLDLKKGDETLFDMIGAKAGREYNNGDIELYEFDKNSAEYKKIIEGKGSIEAAAHNDGIVMVVTKEQHKDLIQKFKDIQFK